MPPGGRKTGAQQRVRATMRRGPGHASRSPRTWSPASRSCAMAANTTGPCREQSHTRSNSVAFRAANHSRDGASASKRGAAAPAGAHALNAATAATNIPYPCHSPALCRMAGKAAALRAARAREEQRSASTPTRVRDWPAGAGPARLRPLVRCQPQ